MSFLRQNIDFNFNHDNERVHALTNYINISGRTLIE